ncbi:MAG: nickel pincer cofactor biosynthesis protein LarB, partial [Propionibacteriaceae bacterium]
MSRPADPSGLARIAELDHDRHRRRGYPEAVYAEHKTPDQLARIATELRGRASTQAPALFTRVQPDGAAAILAELPDAVQHADASMIIWPPEPQPAQGGGVAVLCAGTSDLPVAREAELTCRHLGRDTTLVVDVGVAGLHRVLDRLPLLESVAAIVVVAGMDGALPSVV